MHCIVKIECSLKCIKVCLSVFSSLPVITCVCPIRTLSYIYRTIYNHHICKMIIYSIKVYSHGFIIRTEIQRPLCGQSSTMIVRKVVLQSFFCIIRCYLAVWLKIIITNVYIRTIVLPLMLRLVLRLQTQYYNTTYVQYYFWRLARRHSKSI